MMFLLDDTSMTMLIIGLALLGITNFCLGFWFGQYHLAKTHEEDQKLAYRKEMCRRYGCTLEELHDRVMEEGGVV